MRGLVALEWGVVWVLGVCSGAHGVLLEALGLERVC